MKEHHSRWRSVPTAPSRRSDVPTQQALRLRKLGLSYPAIAVVMAEYHGEAYGENTWRDRLKALGAQPIRTDARGALALHAKRRETAA